MSEDFLEGLDLECLLEPTQAEIDAQFTQLNYRLCSIRLELFGLLPVNSGISLGQVTLGLHSHSLSQLQTLYPAFLHQRVCEQYNIYWPLVWELRSVCGRTSEGHGPWERCADIPQSHHFSCRRCTLVKVIPP
jgi:hypothetical protein